MRLKLRAVGQAAYFQLSLATTLAAGQSNNCTGTRAKMSRKVLSQFFLSAAVLFTSQARTYSVQGDKLHLGDLISAEAFPNEGLSKIGGANVDKQAILGAQGRGGPIYTYFTDDLRNKRANANIATQVENCASQLPWVYFFALS